MPLQNVAVDEAVRGLRPDFRVLALRVSGIRNGPSTPESEAWLVEAEAVAQAAAPGVHPHIAAWQEAYRAFGVKPQRTPSSVEALWQRAVKRALPRVNWLVDLYDAVSAALEAAAEALVRAVRERFPDAAIEQQLLPATADRPGDA